MPYDDPDPSDPMALSGVLLPGVPGGAEEAAYAFAEELARGGLPAGAILQVFRDPEFRGPFAAQAELGEERVAEIVRECTGVFQACRAAARRYATT